MSQQPGPVPSHLRGALDLSALRQPAGQPATGAGPAATAGAGAAEGTWVLDGASQQDLQQLVQLSSRVPVLVHLAIGTDPASDQIDAVLQPAVDAQGGRLVLARVDAGAEPQFLQIFGLASGPAVVAVLGGQPIPVINQPIPADQLDQLLAELLSAAAQSGVTGTVPPLGPAREYGDAAGADAEPAAPPLHQKAQDALAAADYQGAQDAYREALAEKPNDDQARIGLARAGLLSRTSDLDASAVRQRAAEGPDDVEAQMQVADLDVLGGHVEDAFSRLVRFIAGHPGPERTTAREHLIELYAIVGDQDPRTAASRKALAMALF